MKKKFMLFVTFLLVMVFMSITACGSGNTGDSENNGSDEPGKTKITIWVQMTQYPFVKSIEADFEKANPTINLDIKSQPESQLGGSLDATLATDTAPDIVATYGGMVATTLVKSGRLLNINDVIAPIEDKLVESAKNNKKDGNGEYFTAPLHGFASPVIFYNKNLFEEMKASNKLNAAQKAAVKEPATYAELKALAEACAAYDVEAITGGFSTWHLPHFMQAMHTRTMTVEDYAKTLDRQAEVNPFDNDSFEDGFRLLKRYHQDGILAKNITSYDVDTCDNLFYNDLAAMRMGTSLDYDALNENVTFDLGVFYLPAEETNPEAPLATTVFVDVLAVNAKTTKADACKTFISYIMQADVQAKLAEFSLFPARADSDISELLPSTLRPLFNEISENGSNDFYQSWSFSGIDIQLLNGGKNVISANGANLEAAYDEARELVANYFDTASKN